MDNLESPEKRGRTEGGNVAYIGPSNPGQKSKVPCDETKFKTKMCKNYIQTGACTFGPACLFAHGDHEMGQVPIVKPPRYL